MSSHDETAPSDDAALLDELHELALTAAAAAAQRHVERDLGDVESKSSATDPVTQVDRDSEELITATILEARPDDSILGEEGADVDGTSRVRWVVDPLDGTVNYVYSFPSHAVSIAAEVDGEVAVGVVHDTALGVVYDAVVGRGARRDGVTISPSDVDDVGVALLATGFGYDKDQRARQGAIIAELLPQVRDIRRAGSAAIDLCMVAAGLVDGYYETGPNHWDVAAGALIVREAGGDAVYDPTRRRTIAAGRRLFAPLSAAVEAAESAQNRV